MCEGDYWREQQVGPEPMHKWYARGLFDVWEEKDILAEFPACIDTVDGLAAAGVQIGGLESAGLSGDGCCVGGPVNDVVQEHVFCRWVWLENMPVGSALFRWYVEDDASEEDAGVHVMSLDQRRDSNVRA